MGTATTPVSPVWASGAAADIDRLLTTPRAGVAAVTITVPPRVAPTRLEKPPHSVDVGVTGSHTGEADAYLAPFVRRWVSNHLDVMVAAGYRKIMLHGTHQAQVASSEIRDNSADKAVLHVYNWAFPSVITTSRYINGTDSNIGSVTFGDEVNLMGGKTSSYTVNESVNVGEELEGFRFVLDDVARVVAVTKANSLMIVFDIIHNDDENTDLTNGILDRVFGLVKAPKIVTLREISVDEIIPKMKKSFEGYKGSSDFKSRLNAINYYMDEAWKHYLSEARKHMTEYRQLKRASMTDDEFLTKATSVVKNLTENPFLIGCAVTGRDNIRVTLKSLPSRYWNGVRNVVCTIPLMSDPGSEPRITLRELKHDDSLSMVPVFNQVIYSDGRICLGSMGNTIVKMLMNGDWDVAVMMTIRGLVGNDDAFRQWLEIYREAKRDSTPEDIVLKKTPMQMLQIYSEDDSRGDSDDDDDEGDGESEEDDE